MEHDSLLKLIPKLSLRSDDIIPAHFLSRVNQYLIDYTIVYCQHMIPMLTTKLAHASRKMVVPLLVLVQQGVGEWLSKIYTLDVSRRQQQYDEYVSSSNYQRLLLTNVIIVDYSFLLQGYLCIAFGPVTH